MTARKDRDRFAGLTNEELVRLQEHWVDQLLDVSKEIVKRKGSDEDPAVVAVEAMTA